MENKPCVKCGNPSLKVWGEHLVSPVNRPYNICEECWDKLDEQEKEIEQEIRTIRINENGDLWLGRHSVQDLIEKYNKVMAISDEAGDILRALNDVENYKKYAASLEDRIKALEKDISYLKVTKR